jgi:eukaryotic-like serine/threonine-protein kinase
MPDPLPPSPKPATAGNSDQQATKALESERPTRPPADESAPAGDQEAPRFVSRYELHEQIGHGGMGCVLRGRDPVLDRELAIKVLLPSHQGNPDMERRFLEEAQVGGQLQHPGIVPVHELGRADDGCPYFTMKLVQGRTLADLLKGRSSPAQELPRFLAIFEQVCQTMAYAHDKGVIHRDLKPANIMVGAFGEVQVMDWGLAKRLSNAECGMRNAELKTEEARLPSSIPHSAFRIPHSGGTQAGAILGTPAYMPPEQAQSLSELIDRRADVFGLGSILCEILTGTPPYVAESSLGVLVQAGLGDVADAFARLDRCGADAELITLARSCLAPKREERPADAGEVARRVTAYPEGVEHRLRTAEMERTAAQARAQEAAARARAERRARRLTQGLAVAVLATVATVGGAAWYLRQQHLEQEAAAARRDAEQARQDVERARDVERSLGDAVRHRQGERWDLAWAALERAAGRLADSTDASMCERVGQVRAELEQLRADQTMSAKLDEARLQLGSSVKEGFDRKGADHLYQQAFIDYGLDPETVTADVAGKRVADSRLSEALIAALDHWPTALDDGRCAKWTRQVADRADRNEWRLALRAALWSHDAAAIRRMSAVPLPEGLPSSTLILFAEALKGAGDSTRAIEVLRQGLERSPDDFWLHFALASYLSRQGPEGQQEAIRYYTAARALRPRSAAVHVNLGATLKAQKKLPEAIAAYREAIRLQPDLVQAHYNLGRALHAQGKLPEAIAAFEEAIRCNPDYILAHDELARALHDHGQLAEAVVAYGNAIRLQPNDPVIHNNLGNTLQMQAKLLEAVAAYREALRLKPDYPEASCNLGNALRGMRKLPEAVEAFRTAIRHRPNFAGAHRGLAMTLHDMRKLPEAVASYGEAIRLRPNSADAHNGLGAALNDQGKLPEAVAAYREAIRLQPTFAEAHSNLGIALSAQRKWPNAIAAFQEAIRCKPAFAYAHHNLGLALSATGKLSEAITSYRDALRLRPDHPGTHYNLGNALRSTGQLTEAATAFNDAIRVRPDHAEAHTNLGLTLADLGRLTEAVAACEEAIRRKPDLANAHAALAIARRGLGQFDQALDSLRKSQKHGAQQPGWPTADIDASIQQLERLAALDAALPSILTGDRKPSGPDERIELARLCTHPARRLYAASARFFGAAFAEKEALADDLAGSNRYDAACSAALAAREHGQDRPRPDATERTALRRQARAWLQKDLAAWSKVLDGGKPPDRTLAARQLFHWQQDADLSGLRHPWSLMRLPANERRHWQQLWADVEALRTKAAMD